MYTINMLHGVIQSANSKLWYNFLFVFRFFLRISYLHVKLTLKSCFVYFSGYHIYMSNQHYREQKLVMHFSKKSKIYVSINKVDCTIYCLAHFLVTCQVHITELNSQKSEINIQNTNRAYHINIQYFHFCCAFRIII